MYNYKKVITVSIDFSFQTVSLGLKRMTPSNNLLNNYASSNISTTATNSASSTASLLSTANIQQAPGVLAAKHWPDFHNGVAVGLSISPHASVSSENFACSSSILIFITYLLNQIKFHLLNTFQNKKSVTKVPVYFC